MTLASLGGALTAVLALAIGVLPSHMQSPWLIGAVFVMLTIAESGVLLGRKTYLIDQTDKAHRPTLVALANSAMGLIALLMGSLGIVAQIFGIHALIAVLGLFCLAGATLASMLPEPQSSQLVSPPPIAPGQSTPHPG